MFDDLSQQDYAVDTDSDAELILGPTLPLQSPLSVAQLLLSELGKKRCRDRASFHQKNGRIAEAASCADLAGSYKQALEWLDEVGSTAAGTSVGWNLSNTS